MSKLLQAYEYILLIIINSLQNIFKDDGRRLNGEYK